MLSLRNLELLNESPTAKQTFRRLQLANRICYALLIILVLLGIWNVITLAGVIRGSTSDLVDVASIREHISSRLIWATSLLTLGLFIFKEWRWGERNFSTVFFLGGLLFLTLIPTMSAEVEPTEEQLTLELTYSLCQPGGLEGFSLLDARKCDVKVPAQGEVYLAPSNPIDTDAEWMNPVRIEQGYTRWNVQARGRFRAYFIVKQPSMEYCQNARVVPSANQENLSGHTCFEHDGATWLTLPFETSAAESGYMIIYQEAAP